MKHRYVKHNSKQVQAGRKYRLSLICLILILAGCSLATINPAFMSILPTYISGILAVLALYNTGNVASTWANGKSGQITVSQTTVQEE